MIEQRNIQSARDRLEMMVISSEPPWPLDSGGHLRTFHMQNAMAAYMNVHMLCPVIQNKLPWPEPPECTAFTFERYQVPARTFVSECVKILSAQMSRSPYSMYKRHDWPGLRNRWMQTVDSRKPDFLWFDHIDSFLYHKRDTTSRSITILDMHNVYSLILERLSVESRNPLKRAALMLEARRMARMEWLACQVVDIVIAVSQSEVEHFEKLGARCVFLAPNGVVMPPHLPESTRHSASSSPIVLFLGAMNWHPNVSAAMYLAHEVFPAVRRRFPEAQLKIVGKDPLSSVSRLSDLPGVSVTGKVPDVSSYLAEATVMAVPLASGGGTRLKILESFAAGLPVISTPVGVEGIDAKHGVHLWVSELNEFAEGIIKVMENGSDNEIVQNALNLIRKKYQWSAIAEDCVRFLESQRT